MAAWLDRSEIVGTTRSEARVSPHAADGPRLEVMTVRVQERRLPEHPRARPALRPEFREPLGPFRDAAFLVRNTPDAICRHNGVEMFAGERVDDRERAIDHGVPVPAEPCEIDRGAQRMDLRVGHAGTDIATRDAHARGPVAPVHDLPVVHDETIDAEILDARDMPDEPPGMRSSSELSLRKAAGELVPHRPVELLVANAKEVECIHARDSTSPANHTARSGKRGRFLGGRAGAEAAEGLAGCANYSSRAGKKGRGRDEAFVQWLREVPR